MKTKYALVALVVATLLSGCATPGTKVTSSSDAWKSMARSQQAWCAQVGGCDCQMDGQPVTCSLAATCVNSGSCKQ